MAAKKKATPKVEGEVVKDDATTITPSVDDTTKEDVVTSDTTVNTDTTPEVTPDTTGATEGGADDANTGDETPVDPEGTSEGSNDDDNKDGEVTPPSTDSETTPDPEETPDDTEAPQDNENTTTDPEPSDNSNVNESAPEADAADIKVGDDVVIIPACKTTVTGTAIPSFAYRNVYRVKKILPDRIVIACGLLTYGVKASDVNKA